ncbi:TetR family transcriptional regulator [Labedaea rhizosphaerae]|uniref:TetR family transcriptional regulator n=2 Tax=Labedaea rhizosphaerae TaxID=598644 RepID=A0A4R6SKV0_LABRH|nr:TetR family transcriptional regulator [Labedaea rhizosphaerae]
MLFMTTPRPLTARHQALLEQLEELFLAEGFASFTLDDLAARLRCSKSTLYALADSKEQLAVTVVSRFFHNAASRIERRVAGEDDPRKVIGRYFEGISEELGVASEQFITDVAGTAATRTIYESRAREAARRIREFLAEGARIGVFRDVHTELVAQMVSLVIESIQTGELRSRVRVTDAEAFAGLRDLLLEGVMRDGSRR